MRRLTIGVAITFIAGGCSVGAAPPSPGPAVAELTVFAAASLTGALEAVKTAYEAAVPGVSLTLSTDSSSTLATQIEQGAPADVFLSADTANATRLAAGGFASGDPVPFATNTLAIIVPSDNPGAVRTPVDLARPGLRVIAAGDAVPITGYAEQLIEKLAAEPGYPDEFATAYAASIRSREDNVKAIVAKLELGEGDAGIVYVTDAKASTRVVTIDVPDGSNVSAIYAGVVVKASRHQGPATAFLAWLAGPAGQSILASSGFGPPD